MSNVSSTLPKSTVYTSIDESNKEKTGLISDGDSVSRVRSYSKARSLKDVLGFLMGLSVIIFFMGYRLGKIISTSQNIHLEGRISSIVRSESKTPYQPSIDSLQNPTAQARLDDRSDADFDESKGRALVTYVYSETPNFRKNALFFVNHGLHAYADFIFILNGPTDLISYIPGQPNIQVIRRNNISSDLESHAEILRANQGALIKKYKKFIMLDASIRGPFLPAWSNECWSDAYLDRLTFETKLVGLSMDSRCNADGKRHTIIQPMLLATDRIGLSVLLKPIGKSFTTLNDVLHIEESTAQTILDAGYGISVMKASLASNRDYRLDKCAQDEVSSFDTSIHPYETIFQEANQDNTSQQLELLTEQHGQARYSSWDTCWMKKIRSKG
ncbi:hypothetical protein TWF225_009330 [Orbilia oligospora]|nr:hypothetical protein TWF225_009330 [Orbilia oligospora]KAF3269968.1 hypothetical protein TWF217_008314 [Orbilia oligospora]KAF3270431.1 hypothetical protein TWF128_004206 [Orbilia oligospora]KAF3298081.1 hypothetical protein TWF132_004219 [Orbilia oligospora]